MILPIGDEPNPRTVPYATTCLVVLNVGIWLLFCLPLTGQALQYDSEGMPYYLRIMHELTGIDRVTLFRRATAYDLQVFRLGFRPASPSLLALGCSMFLHAGWAHLAGNMWFLWLFGNNVEARLGPMRYVACYLACGVVATLSYAAFRPSSPLPLIGASGAISGVLGCYFVWFPRHRVRVLFVLVIFFYRTTVPAWLALTFYLLVENLYPLLVSSTVHATATGIAYGAHVGGFVAGAAFAWAYARSGATWFDLPDVLQARRDGARLALVAEVRRLLQQGTFELAWHAFLRLPLPASAHVQAREVLLLADWLTQARNYPQAQALLAEAQNTVGLAEPDVGAGLWLRRGLLAWRGQGDAGTARGYLQSALAASGGVGAVAEAAQLALEEMGG